VVFKEDKQLLAIMAAIIHAGADSNERAPGYDPVTAVNKAEKILAECETRIRE
jgi:pyruvate kinase